MPSIPFSCNRSAASERLLVSLRPPAPLLAPLSPPFVCAPCETIFTCRKKGRRRKKCEKPLEYKINHEIRLVASISFFVLPKVGGVFFFLLKKLVKFKRRASLSWCSHGFKINLNGATSRRRRGVFAQKIMKIFTINQRGWG